MIAADRVSYSPHFNPARPSGVGVVIHATRSGRVGNPTELAGTLNHFANPYPANPEYRASSHWVIGRAGEKVRVISDSSQAWHAGQHNATHWGIELEQGVEGDGFTDAQIEALITVCRGYVDDFGVPPLHAINVWGRGFIGHDETAQGIAAGKTDPGRLFPWQRFIAGLQEEVQVQEPTEAELRLGVIETLVSGKYRPVALGRNGINELVVELRNQDGTPADPPIVLAVPRL